MELIIHGWYQAGDIDEQGFVLKANALNCM